MKLDTQRVFDLIVAIPATVVLAPLLLAIGTAVRLTSPGPAVYRGTRVGQHERPFQQWKFRSMLQDAEARGLWWTSGDDPRITRIGRFLRRTSLDELPQLWNVIRGEMSLVGPRPASFPQLDQYTDEQRRIRASVRPGITGMHQARGRSANSVERAIALDLEYVQTRKLRLDVQLIIETVGAVLGRRGVT